MSPLSSGRALGRLRAWVLSLPALPLASTERRRCPHSGPKRPPPSSRASPVLRASSKPTRPDGRASDHLQPSFRYSTGSPRQWPVEPAPATIATERKRSYERGSRLRLNPRHTKYFPGESLEDAVGRSVCLADCLPAKVSNGHGVYSTGWRVPRARPPLPGVWGMLGTTTCNIVAAEGLRSWWGRVWMFSPALLNLLRQLF